MNLVRRLRGIIRESLRSRGAGRGPPHHRGHRGSDTCAANGPAHDETGDDPADGGADAAPPFVDLGAADAATQHGAHDGGGHAPADDGGPDTGVVDHPRGGHPPG